MKRKTITLMSTVILFLLIVVTAYVSTTDRKREAARTQQAQVLQQIPYQDLYVCAMHPWEASDQPGTCELCRMKLSKVEGHKPGTPLPDESGLYVLASNPMKVFEGKHEGTIPITESPYYDPSSKPAETAGTPLTGEMKGEIPSSSETSESGLWTCGMHPQVIQDHPGLCPICHMELTPLKTSAQSGSNMTVRIDPVTMQNIGVRTEFVARRDLSIDIRSNGTVGVAEDRETTLNARVSGWVEDLHVSRTGDFVTTGEPLLDIYSPELVAAQEEYLLALRSGEMLKTSGVTSVASGGADLLAAAKKRLQLWGITDDQIARLEQTRKTRKTLTLVAPMDGYVLKKNVIEGAAVKPGMDLFTITDLSHVWVIAQIYEYETPWVHVGDEVSIESSYLPGKDFSGRVDYIYPTVDSVTRTTDVRVVLANPNLALKPDMYVEVNLHARPVRDAISISKSAVIRSGTRDLVFIEKAPGIFEPREVHLGIETDRYYEVEHNLQAGEKVVISAQFLLDSEAKLQEAIQRRIDRTRETGSAETTVDATAHAGHIH
ncbi:MAG: efflux RND transporter periplasmic adaptor subunit [bacterium]